MRLFQPALPAPPRGLTHLSPGKSRLYFQRQRVYHSLDVPDLISSLLDDARLGLEGRYHPIEEDTQPVGHYMRYSNEYKL